jgi:hypothetical protein
MRDTHWLRHLACHSLANHRQGAASHQYVVRQSRTSPNFMKNRYISLDKLPEYRLNSGGHSQFQANGFTLFAGGLGNHLITLVHKQRAAHASSGFQVAVKVLSNSTEQDIESKCLEKPVKDPTLT